MQANATKRLHKFHNRYHFSRDAKRIYGETYYSHASSTYYICQVSFKWLEHEFTARKVRGSNPTSAYRIPLSKLGQPDNIPALMLPCGGMAARHRKGVTAERFYFDNNS
ncbi:hypothetical protein CSKR_109828 [Clonorchis sinensis]|uniref:Uncharacterized protein n=1 Tax=Clonorchis sinensis TaxID=79923 RepID=A0A3R7G436_CLOSI|nr:hypothetical protein CSKR_109828 [Clonorchis sinensis]